MAVKETVVLSVETDSSKAEGSVKSLKAQLREAQAEVGKMADKFGETSAQAVEAAKRAADLKDRIGDAKALTDAFNPDKKFQAFSSALSGVAGGFSAVQGAMGLMGAETENVEKMMLKVQSAMALSQGLSAVTESIDAFKNLGAVISNLSIVQKASAVAQRIWNAAMSANPLGAIIVAITALISGIVMLIKYFKESSAEAEAQAKAVKGATKALDDQKRAIDSANESMERKQKNELAMAKASGMSAEAIKKLERKLIDEKIATAEATAQIALNTVQKEKNYLASLKQADADDEIIKAQEENVKKAREILKSANEDVIKSGKERQAIYDRQRVEETQAETDANKKKKEENKKHNDEVKEANKKANEDILKLQQENTLLRIADERKRAEAKLEIDLENSKKEINNSKASAELKAKQIQALEEKYILDLRALQAKNAEEDKKKKEEQDKKDAEDRKKKLDEQLKAEKETFDLVNQARLSQIKDAGVKRQEEEAIRYQTEIDNLYNALNNKEITEADFNARKEALKTMHEQKLTEIEKVNADERIKTAQAEYQAKVSLWNQTGSAIGQLADVIGKSTGLGKALGLAQIAIDTGVAISALTRNSQANPANAVTGGVAGAIQFATGIVQILANIKKAKELLTSAKVPGGGGGGGGMPTVSATAPITPQMSSTALNQQMINQVGNATTRAFVVESDVSGNQERIRRLNRAARIN
ncbi:MAG: hypothetical protein ACK5DE_06300 [Bacteroidota bacterium]|jgi:DNA repair exonuclease SbcCD ATPase subunit